MSYYRSCRDCGANLDPGERCDCKEEKETAASATNTDSGRVERDLQDHFSTSNDIGNQWRLQV